MQDPDATRRGNEMSWPRTFCHQCLGLSHDRRWLFDRALAPLPQRVKGWSR